jgi:deoxyribose-phosphate aldolase
MNPEMLKGLNEKSNDGTTAVFESNGGQQITFVKTSSGWKLDLLAGMDPAQAQMMEQAAPMMGMMIGPMKKATEAIAAKIRSGEIASAEEVPAAIQQEMMKSMGGGLGGGGGGRGRAPRN